MRVGWIAAALFGVSVASCGLETVETLPAPSVNYLDSTLVTDYTLSIKGTSQYDGTDFQGYQIYYKVYPGQSSGFSRLAADRDSVNLSPTVNQLMNLGYFQMSQSASPGPTPLLSPALVKPGDNDTITLDFSTGFYQLPLNQPLTYPQPQLEINGSTIAVSKPNLFRTILLAGTPAESFTVLVNSTTASAIDMAGLSTVPNQYEINVFVVAYGLSSTLQAIYSTPVPWGVIRSAN